MYTEVYDVNCLICRGQLPSDSRYLNSDKVHPALNTSVFFLILCILDHRNDYMGSILHGTTAHHTGTIFLPFFLSGKIAVLTHLSHLYSSRIGFCKACRLRSPSTSIHEWLMIAWRQDSCRSFCA